MRATAWRPGSATTAAARGAEWGSRRSSTTSVTTFEAGRIVRIKYFTEWSEALDAVGAE